MPFDFHQLEEFLVCPASKSPLVQDGHSLVCTDKECRLSFAIRDDIPVMLIEEAETLSSASWAAILQKHGRQPGV